MQGTRVQSLVQEDPTCQGAAKPMCRNYWARDLEPTSHETTVPTGPRAWALPQEKPPQEDRAPQLKSRPCSPQLEKVQAQWRPSTAKNKQIFKNKVKKKWHVLIMCTCVIRDLL